VCVWAWWTLGIVLIRPFCLALSLRHTHTHAHIHTQGLRAEVADRGVGVTLVCPGYVRTSLSLNAVTGSGASYGKMDEATAKGVEPAALAAQVLAAVAHNEDEVLACDAASKAAVFARTLLPGLLSSYMRRRAAKGWKELRK